MNRGSTTLKITVFLWLCNAVKIDMIMEKSAFFNSQKFSCQCTHASKHLVIRILVTMKVTNWATWETPSLKTCSGRREIYISELNFTGWKISQIGTLCRLVARPIILYLFFIFKRNFSGKFPQDRSVYWWDKHYICRGRRFWFEHFFVQIARLEFNITNYYRRSTNTLCIVRQCTTIFILKNIASSHGNISLSGVYKFNYKIIVLSQIFDPEVFLFVL